MAEQWRFVQARNFHKGRARHGTTPCRARLFVGHDMEYAQTTQSAEAVARMFHDQPLGGVNHNGGSSAHGCADQDSIVQCVSMNDTAFAAPRANADGVHLELPGFARWTREQWLTPHGKDVLVNGALFWAHCFIAVRRAGHFQPKMRLLTIGEILDERTCGFTDHRTITDAFNTVGGHTDPGPNFPWDLMLTQVETLVTRLDIPTWKAPFR